MHSDDVTNTLTDGEVFELLSKEHESAVFDDSLLIDRQRLVSNLHRADVPIALVGLVRKGAVEDDCVEVVAVI